MSFQDAVSRDSKPSRRSRGASMLKLLLVYPGLLVAVIGAVPNYMEKYNAARESMSVQELRKQTLENRMWQENFECRISPDKPADVGKIFAEAVICPSGTILVLIVRREGTPTYKWIPKEEIDAPGESGLLSGILNALSPIAVAHAQSTVICQKWISGSMLKRRIRAADGTCYDEVVDTGTGRVVSSTPASCDPNCN